jgi:predicted O-methyltransferase YrrM
MKLNISTLFCLICINGTLLLYNSDSKFSADFFTHNIPRISKTIQTMKFESLLPIKMLEIGSFEGRSALWFLENVLQHESSDLICLDTFNGSEEMSPDLKNTIFENFQLNLKTYIDSGKVKFMRSTSYEGLSELLVANNRKYNNYFDIIYIDGDHTSWATLQDAIFSFNLLKINGLMIFDDYNW